MSNVLVTGAHGFLGRHVARRFAGDGSKVTGIGHGGWPEAEWRSCGLSRWYRADVTVESLEALHETPEIIVHCSGGSSVAASVAAPHDDFRRTVETTAAVLEFVRRKAPAARLILPSSAAIYGEVMVLPIEETEPARPISPYGAHKHMTEDLCRSFAATYGLRVAIVRLFSVYGSGLRKQLLWDACERIRRGEITFSGSGEEVRDWLHVKDAADLLAMAQTWASKECPTVNGGSGKAVRVREVVEEIAALLPGTPKVNFSGVARSGDPKGFQAATGRAEERGWRPSIELRDGISEYVRWHLADAS